MPVIIEPKNPTIKHIAPIIADPLLIVIVVVVPIDHGPKLKDFPKLEDITGKTMTSMPISRRIVNIHIRTVETVLLSFILTL